VGLPASEFISPKSYLNYDLSYVANNWSVSLSGNWRDKVKVLEKQESLFLANAVVAYRFSPKVEISLNVNNLADKIYHTSSYVVLGSDQNGQDVQQYPARGRNWTLKVNYLFE